MARKKTLWVRLRTRFSKIPRRQIYVGISALVLGVCGLSLLYLPTPCVLFLCDSEPDKSVDYEVQFVGELSSDQRALARSITLANMSRPGEDKLNRTAAKLQKLLSARQVHVIATSNKTLVVRVEARRPVLGYKDKRGSWLIDDSGQMYEGQTKARLPRYFGNLSSKRRTTSDGTLLLDQKIAAVLEHAARIASAAMRNSYQLASMHHIPARGFLLDLRGVRAKVLIGFEDTDSKFRQLAQLLSRAKAQGKQLERIELDYAGKAFIKEKS